MLLGTSIMSFCLDTIIYHFKLQLLTSYKKTNFTDGVYKARCEVDFFEALCNIKGNPIQFFFNNYISIINPIQAGAPLQVFASLCQNGLQ